MINRAIIRLKVVQLVYAYYQNEGKTTEVALKELEFSLDKSYDLYRSLLSLLVEIRRMAQHKADVRGANSQLVGGGNDGALAANKFLVQLEENAALSAWAEKQKTSWSLQDKFMKRLYGELLNDDDFVAYVDKGDTSYAADRELVRRLYKTHIIGNEGFDDLLEEQSIYWNDDKAIVDSFVMKTIKRFDPANGAEQELLPPYADKEDQTFAAKLFTTSIERGEEIRDLMRKFTRNWDFSRMALMDVIILQIATAEVMAFPSIPLNVTFSEYIDIARYYSTPRSTNYVHGMLDSIVKELKAEGVIVK